MVHFSIYVVSNDGLLREESADLEKTPLRFRKAARPPHTLHIHPSRPHFASGSAGIEKTPLRHADHSEDIEFGISAAQRPASPKSAKSETAPTDHTADPDDVRAAFKFRPRVRRNADHSEDLEFGISADR